MAEKKPYSRSPQSTMREENMRALAPRVLGGLGVVRGSRSAQRMQMVDVQPLVGSPMVVWVKCAWAPGKHGNCAVQMAFPGKEKRAHTAQECVRIVAEKAARASKRGATHLLLLAADDEGRTALAARILPIAAIEPLTQEAVEVDEAMTLNGASPSFYITGLGERQAALVEVVRKHSIDLLRERPGTVPSMDAIEDLDARPPGIPVPHKQSRMSTGFQRDQAVRDHVVKRAKGHCEFCGVEGFLMASSLHYLEAHHIISLADQGADTVENVIALCPEHHREAHYGARREELEKAMVAKLQVILTPITKPTRR